MASQRERTSFLTDPLTRAIYTTIVMQYFFAQLVNIFGQQANEEAYLFSGVCFSFQLSFAISSSFNFQHVFQTEATGKTLGFQAELEDVDTLGSDTVARTLLTHSAASSLREVARNFMWQFWGHELMIFFGGREGGNTASSYSIAKVFWSAPPKKK